MSKQNHCHVQLRLTYPKKMNEVFFFNTQMQPGLKNLVYTVKCRCSVDTRGRTTVPEVEHASPGGHLNKTHGEAQARM